MPTTKSRGSRRSAWRLPQRREMLVTLVHNSTGSSRKRLITRPDARNPSIANACVNMLAMPRPGGRPQRGEIRGKEHVLRFTQREAEHRRDADVAQLRIATERHQRIAQMAEQIRLDHATVAGRFGREEADERGPPTCGISDKPEQRSQRQPQQHDRRHQRGDRERRLKHRAQAPLILGEFLLRLFVLQRVVEKRVLIAAEERERQAFEQRADREQRERRTRAIGGDAQDVRDLSAEKRLATADEIREHAGRQFEQRRTDLRDRENQHRIRVRTGDLREIHDHHRSVDAEIVAEVEPAEQSDVAARGLMSCIVSDELLAFRHE